MSDERPPNPGPDQSNPGQLQKLLSETGNLVFGLGSGANLIAIFILLICVAVGVLVNEAVAASFEMFPGVGSRGSKGWAVIFVFFFFPWAFFYMRSVDIGPDKPYALKDGADPWSLAFGAVWTGIEAMRTAFVYASSADSSALPWLAMLSAMSVLFALHCFWRIYRTQRTR
ncbi:MAG: hypothetical protein AB7E80_12415 [Hyphomicrobiaceae bacterium]